jgi:nitrogen fixation NifU-like protein
MAAVTYSKPVQDHFRQPRNVGSFPDDVARVGQGQAGQVNTGGIVKLQIRVDESGIISEARFRSYGCGATIAAGSYVTEWLQGKSLDQAARLSTEQLVQALQLQPVKVHCAMLAEDAVKAAITNFHSRYQG